MRRIVVRYRTPFGRWVSDFGASALAEAITRSGTSTAPTTVYSWLAGTKVPTHSRAEAIVSISGGTVRLEDVYAHRRLITHP